MLNKGNTNKPSNKIWIVIIILILFSGAGFYFFKYSDNQKSYVEFPVEQRDIEVSILATGTVQPENRLEIKAPIAGRIDEVLIEEGQKVTKGQILARMSSMDRAALIDAARSQGSEEVKKWQDIYRATPIIAPLSGMIIRRNIEPGQTISNTEPILVMSNHLTVNAQVDETDLAKINLKQKAEIILDAYPENKISAHVDQIAYEAKTVNNVTTYTVNVLPETVPEMMRSGMTANISFILDKKESVLSIPNEVLQSKEGGVQVLLKNKTKIPQAVLIEVGTSNGKYTEVLSGLKKGDIVLREEIKGQGSNNTNPFSPMGAGRRTSGAGKH